MSGAFGVGGHLGVAEERIVVGGRPQQRMTFGAFVGTERVGPVESLH